MAYARRSIGQREEGCCAAMAEVKRTTGSWRLRSSTERRSRLLREVDNRHPEHGFCRPSAFPARFARPDQGVSRHARRRGEGLRCCASRMRFRSMAACHRHGGKSSARSASRAARARRTARSRRPESTRSARTPVLSLDDSDDDGNRRRWSAGRASSCCLPQER